MYKLIRFYNQNRKKIFKIILVIVFAIGMIQLLNYFAKTNNDVKTNDNNMNNSMINIVNEYPEIISNKSAISGGSISNTKLKEDVYIIDNFIKYCNEKNIEEAYELLTDECKELMYPNIDEFYKLYYSKIFDGQQKNYTVENWVGDIYEVKYQKDILATGDLSDSETKQDYITVVKENSDYKLNINNYIGREKVNKVSEGKDIKITVKSIDTYMDYEIYNLLIENNSTNTILLDISDDTKSVYLLDSKEMKYYFYNNEIIENQLKIQSRYTSNLQIKFSNSYSSSRTIKYLVFSKMVLNYEEYSGVGDKAQFEDFYEFKVDV